MKEIQEIVLMNNIKKLRLDKEITQQQLADKVGVTNRTIIALEKGHYNPTVLLAYRIAKVFHLTIEDVFEFEKEEYDENNE
ncbi:MAG: helix-turn-helix transcriptional regulator [Velocimicrobium sp.]